MDTIAPTPEAIKHLNLEVIYKTNGQIISAKTRNKMVMDVMVDDGYLDPHHPEYAHTFLALRLAWLAPVAYKASSLCDTVQSFFDGTPVSPADLYDNVCSHLRPDSAPVVVWAGTHLANDPKTVINGSVGRICFDAFQDMVKAMDAVNAQTKKRLRQNL